MKYKYMDRVIINGGFYEGCYGYVTEVYDTLTNTMHEIMLDHGNKRVSLSEHMLDKVSSTVGVVNGT
jgi:hypothetical protein